MTSLKNTHGAATDHNIIKQKREQYNIYIYIYIYRESKREKIEMIFTTQYCAS